MGSKNNKISAFQFAVIGFLSGASLFEGVASVFLLESSMQNSWITVIIALIVGLLPIGLILYVINYEPEKNIIEKINHLFGPIIGNIMNVILIGVTFVILITNLWSLVNFAEVKYLTETPATVIAILFMATVVYSTIKGIETIARSSEVLLYLFIIFQIFVTFALIGNLEIDNLFPIMENGISPILNGSFKFLTYVIPSFMLLTIIPKSMVEDNKKITKYVINGYVISMLVMLLSIFVVVSVVGPNLADLYRFPSYYVMKKIHLTGFVENLENILSILWIINMYICMSISLHYISTYLNNVFKIKSDLKRVISIIAIAAIAIYLKDKYYYSSVVGILIVRNIYPYIVGVATLIIISIISIKIFFNKKSKEIQNQS
ncbi:MAG: endospore germination permease [Bacilli bacterium]|nr:endospore germination permease [Bacilli bacterium]